LNRLVDDLNKIRTGIVHEKIKVFERKETEEDAEIEGNASKELEESALSNAAAEFEHTVKESRDAHIERCDPKDVLYCSCQ